MSGKVFTRLVGLKILPPRISAATLPSKSSISLLVMYYTINQKSICKSTSQVVVKEIQK